MHPIDERKLVEDCLHNDRIAQKTLYDRFARIMMSVCIRYAGDMDTAQDILQEAFIKIFASLDTYIGKGSLEGWIRRIVVNTALETLRKNDILRETVDWEEAWSSVTIENEAIEKLSADELMTVIASLPTGFRTVFNMFAIEGYSHKEIASALGINESSSRSQYNRARNLIQRKIQQILKENYRDERQ